MKIRSIAIGVAALLATSSAEAAVVYDTITGLPESNRLLLLVQRNHAPLGDAFSASAAETLNSVTVQLIDPNGSSTSNVTDTGSVLMYLVPDSGGLPSHTAATLTSPTYLGTIADTSLLGGSAVNTETVSTSARVAPGNYWIELTSGSDPNNFYQTANSTATSAGWADVASSTAVGALGLPTSGFLSSYQAATDNTGIVGATTNTVFSMQIQATPTATPEPTSLALLGAGLMGLGIGHRRRSGTFIA